MTRSAILDGVNSVTFLLSLFIQANSLAVAATSQLALEPLDVVFTPGAWVTEAHFQPVVADLVDKGYNAFARTLPSFNSSQPTRDTVETDAQFLRDQVLLPCIDAGKHVILVLHSYAGIPGGVAAYGLSKTEREAGGQPGGIIGLIYLSSFLIEEGATLASKLPNGQLLPWIESYVEPLFSF